jgi:hypothetical protein
MPPTPPGDRQRRSDGRQGLYPAQLWCAGDLVSADVVGLSIIRLAVMVSRLAGGLGGECAGRPNQRAARPGFVAAGLSIPGTSVMYGNDARFTDPVVIDRSPSSGRELPGALAGRPRSALRRR